MSQRVVFVDYFSIIHLTSSVYSYIPDEDEMKNECEDYDPGMIEAHWYWYDIGEGESDTDCFYTDEQLMKLWEEGVFEEQIEKDGYLLDLVQKGMTEFIVESKEDDCD